MEEEGKLVAQFRSLIQTDNTDVITFDNLSDSLLLCFIRARKHDLARAHHLLKNYCKMAQSLPHLLTNLKRPEVLRVFNLGYQYVPSVRDSNGCRIIIFKSATWDSKDCDLDTLLCSVVYCVQVLASEVKTQQSGVIAIGDFKDLSLHQVRQVHPRYPRRWAQLVNGILPIRFKGIHFINEPWIFRVLNSMIWPFLSAKIRSRTFFHGDSMESLHQHIDPAVLPEEYGGHFGPLEKMTFSKFLTQNDSSFLFHVFD